MERAFALAFALANHWHTGHMRKGTEIPYISHLMAVSALVLEYGGTLEQASAALLHDVIEDTNCTIEEIIKLVSNDVAQIVLECTHVEFAEITDKEAKTVAKKTFYLERLLSPDRLAAANLVALCDKTHNIECTVRDWQISGQDKSMFNKFNGGYEIQKNWYTSLANAFDTLDVPADLRTRFRTAVTTVFGGTQ
jgi:(p)ppGpp synthase/HD superfamily hydrolase